MIKLSQIPAPAYAGVVREKNVRSAQTEILNCRYHGAKMIDLHLSCLEDPSLENIQRIVKFSKLPILALNYNGKYDWSDAGYDTEEARVDLLLRAVEAGAAGIDMQGYTFHRPSKDGFCGEDKYSFTKANPKEVVTDEAIIAKQCELIDKVHAMGAEVLLSCHPGVFLNCEQALDLVRFLEKRNPDIIKIVIMAETEEEMLECIRTMITLKKEIKTPVSYHAGGKWGALTRVVNPALGGQIAFCVDHFTESSTLGQLELKMAVETIENLKLIMG